jgi:hypothetical protein
MVQVIERLHVLLPLQIGQKLKRGWVGPSEHNCYVLMDLPTLICIKHNGDDKPEDRN